jgi:hypothetical protein
VSKKTPLQKYAAHPCTSGRQNQIFLIYEESTFEIQVGEPNSLPVSRHIFLTTIEVILVGIGEFKSSRKYFLVMDFMLRRTKDPDDRIVKASSIMRKRTLVEGSH